MAFFQAIDGSRYPVSEIIRVSPAGRASEAGRPQTIELRNGDTVFVSESRVQDIMRNPVQTFAAAPGTFILVHNDTMPLAPFKWPVIGWAITNDGEVCPITMDGVNDGSNETHSVLMPSGHITSYQRVWDSLPKWVESQDE